MEKNFKEALAEAVRLQSAMVEEGILTTNVATRKEFIEIECTCDEIEKCATAMTLINKSYLFQKGEMGIYNTQTEEKSLWFKVSIV